ncbi:hypothetical protein EDX97_07795 [Absicoccus porci]|uniref:Uncharacterized protein n=1 Tax=Absicoccus porci TaxID=2486576 RepID=A0A3N0I0Y9_9FIRM|nr:hypothetical protein [Absicoccus porci]RNM30673.1 hypothetical protein EDX97_07795 [Absicoccus porci]
MDYRMMEYVTDLAVEREESAKRVRSKLKHAKKKHRAIRFLAELTYTGAIAAVLMYLMLAVTAWVIG